MLSDSLYVVIFLFFLVIAAVILGIVLNKFNDAFQSNPDITDTAKDVVSTGESQFPSLMDWIVALMLFGLPLVALGLAFINNIPSTYFWISVGVIALMAVLGFSLSGLYDDATGDSLFSAQSARMPVSDYIFSNYGFYAMYVFFIIGLGTFVKLRGGG